MLDLYKNIRLRRKELGMTQTELADRTGYTNKSSIASIEAGKIDLPQSKILEFAKALGVTPSYLMGWESDEEEFDDVLPVEPKSEMEVELLEIFRELSEEGMKKVLEYEKFILYSEGI